MPSKSQRPRWDDLSTTQQQAIQELVGHRVVSAENCPGGFSPGFASRLLLGDGRRVFVKAIDLQKWPHEGDAYRREIEVTQALPTHVPAPRPLATESSDSLVALAFEDINGHNPEQPWHRSDMEQVCRVLDLLSTFDAPKPLLSMDHHPRLGGWADIAADDLSRNRLAVRFPWASARLDELVTLEQRGLQAARGHALAHFDLYAHNVVLAEDGAVVVDWPHARPAAAFVDTVMLLSTVSDAHYAERLWRRRPVSNDPSPKDVTAVLAAHAGFCVAGAVWPPTPGLERITRAKDALAQGALTWLEHRWS